MPARIAGQTGAASGVTSPHRRHKRPAVVVRHLEAIKPGAVAGHHRIGLLRQDACRGVGECRVLARSGRPGAGCEKRHAAWRQLQAWPGRSPDSASRPPGFVYAASRGASASSGPCGSAQQPSQNCSGIGGRVAAAGVVWYPHAPGSQQHLQDVRHRHVECPLLLRHAHCRQRLLCARVRCGRAAGRGSGQSARTGIPLGRSSSLPIAAHGAPPHW